MKAGRLTIDQMEVIDSAIIRALEGNTIRASVLEHNRIVVTALATLPPGKSNMRYVDGALQRLRREKAIKHTRKGWRIS